MTFIIVLILGAGVLMLVSAIEDISIADELRKILSGQTPDLSKSK